MADTRILVGGADARATATEIILPVMRGIVGIFYPTDDGPTSIQNWLDGGADASVVGTPTYGAGYVRSPDASNRISTGLAETLASTLYCVWRSSAAFSSSSTRPIPFGIFRSQSSGFAGTSIRVTATPSSAPAATVDLSAARDNAGTPTLLGAAITVADASAWNLIVGRVKDGAVTGARHIKNWTTGVEASADAATGRTLANTSGGTNILSIGNNSSLSYGTCDVACAILANVAHTDAEVAANVAAIREALAFDHSITV